MFKKQQNQKQKRKKREDKFSLKDCLKRNVRDILGGTNDGTLVCNDEES